MHLVRFLSAIVLAAGMIAAASQEPNNPPRGSEVEVLTRGPIHEAFAFSVAVESKPGPIVTKTPPQPLEELPPDEKPEGEDVQWIPGYWFWDDERSDFIWVSGSWRVPPPNMQWVPG